MPTLENVTCHFNMADLLGPPGSMVLGPSHIRISYCRNASLCNLEPRHIGIQYVHVGNWVSLLLSSLLLSVSCTSMVPMLLMLFSPSLRSLCTFLSFLVLRFFFSFASVVLILILFSCFFILSLLHLISCLLFYYSFLFL